jgi:pimeloyl-[acyl-carrier protein] methyl ester esterase
MSALYCKRSGHGTPLILLHGWGFHGAIWDNLAASLALKWEVWQFDLPGHGRSSWTDTHIEQLGQTLAAHIPPAAVWLGWSLGGLVALAAAAHALPSALILVATTPKFVASSDWPHALSPTILAEFALRLRQDYHATLQRFLALQVTGCADAKAQIRALKPLLWAYPPQALALERGLAWLAESDQRTALAALRCPALLLHGAYDALVPAAVAPDCSALYPSLRTHCVAKAGHIPFLSHPQAFLDAVSDFLHEPRSTTD